MSSEHKYIVLMCDCHCSMFVVEKYKWSDGSIDYNISVKDSNYFSHNSLKNRIKNAFRALFGKPIWYNDLYIEGDDKLKIFISDLEDLIYTEL